MPHCMQQPRGRSVTTTFSIDALHVSNNMTQTFSYWICDLQKASAHCLVWQTPADFQNEPFLAEHITLKACLITMFWHPMPKAEPTYVLCDNESGV